MQKKLLAILVIGLIAGTMDILAAITQYSIKVGSWSPAPVLKFVASGWLGERAFSGEPGIEVYGLLFHYMVALIFTIFYVILYHFIPLLAKQPFVCGIIYGLLVWIIMNWLVLPLSLAPRLPFTWSGALTAAGILIVCIGLPIALLTKRWVRQ